MLQAGSFNGNFAGGNPQRIHQIEGILIGAVGRTEAGHGDTQYIFARKSQHIKCFYADKQCQGGIKSPRNSHNNLLRMGMQHPFGQSGYLNVEYLLATFGQRRAFRHKRMRIYRTCKCTLYRCRIKGNTYRFGKKHSLQSLAEAGVNLAVVLQIVDIYF